MFLLDLNRRLPTPDSLIPPPQILRVDCQDLISLVAIARTVAPRNGPETQTANLFNPHFLR